MTAQEHIDKIGAALIENEKAIAVMEKVLRTLKRGHRQLHADLNAAQKAYKAEHDPDNVVQLFSGGTDKPPVDDPDEPVEP